MLLKNVEKEIKNIELEFHFLLKKYYIYIKLIYIIVFEIKYFLFFKLFHFKSLIIIITNIYLNYRFYINLIKYLIYKRS